MASTWHRSNHRNLLKILRHSSHSWWQYLMQAWTRPGGNCNEATVKTPKMRGWPQTHVFLSSLLLTWPWIGGRRIPISRQAHAAPCGPAVLDNPTILAFFKHSHDKICPHFLPVSTIFGSQIQNPPASRTSPASPPRWSCWCRSQRSAAAGQRWGLRRCATWRSMGNGVFF